MRKSWFWTGLVMQSANLLMVFVWLLLPFLVSVSFEKIILFIILGLYNIVSFILLIGGIIKHES